MHLFPSLEWCRALVEHAKADPDIAAAARDWGGRSIGVVVGAGGGLARDFCVYAEVDASRPELKLLRACEDEDDVEVDEPDYLFRVPYALCRQMLSRAVDPLEMLRSGRVRVEGDLQFLVVFAQKHRLAGDRIVAAVPTRFA